MTSFFNPERQGKTKEVNQELIEIGKLGKDEQTRRALRIFNPDTMLLLWKTFTEGNYAIKEKRHEGGGDEDSQEDIEVVSYFGQHENEELRK